MRTFIAICIPEGIQSKLEQLIDQLRGKTPAGTVSWARREGMHLTLKFLGEIVPGKVEVVRQILQDVVPVHAPFTLFVAGLGSFPNVRRPRVVWVGIDDPSGVLSNLYSHLETAFEAQGFGREQRPFHPHLTLGRVRRTAREADVRALGTQIQNVQVGVLGEVPVLKVTFFRSELHPSGAIHTELASIPIGGDR